ncbi:galactose oxidase-like domain-containing protein [Kribbella deserti]|uniref:Galactose oxidase-like domain-containing protein n=1 Tax=Kribbella deserti TaxID=1926257 RepID=A0ABV6QEX5_9ACTN
MSSPDGSKVNAVHISVLSTGKVLITAGSGYNRENFAARLFRAWVFDPNTKALTPVPNLPDDLFCSGHMHDQNGVPIFFGGTGRYGSPASFPGSPEYYTGTRKVYAFDVYSNSFKPRADMAVARWYPNAVANAAGRPVVVGGLDANSVATDVNESYSTQTNTTTVLPGRRAFPMYAGLHLLASGYYFYSGQNTFGRIGHSPGIWNWTNNAFKPVPGLAAPDCRDQSASVMMYPAQAQKVMLIGGGCTTSTTGTTAIATLTGAAPTYKPGPWLGWPTMYSCAINLPDRSVFVAGGSNHNTNPQLRASVLKYGATTWTPVASPKIAREYHSSCALNVDGSVDTFGSNVGTNVETRVERYRPWYMHTTRPAITGGIGSIIYLGGTSLVSYSGPYKITDATLTRLTSSTHSSDPNARQVRATVVQQSTTGKIGLRYESRWGVMPLGKYMLSLIDSRGVPSVSRIVQVVKPPSGSSAPAYAAQPVGCAHCCGGEC